MKYHNKKIEKYSSIIICEIILRINFIVIIFNLLLIILNSYIVIDKNQLKKAFLHSLIFYFFAV